jgi:uncharacterized protein (DUF1778 family)
MSNKNLDAQGRHRCKTVAFRMSPGEAELLDRLASISGMTKQDYIIDRVLSRKVTVIPNKRMQMYMEQSMLYVYKELRRLEPGGSIPDDLLQLMDSICRIFVALGVEDAEEPAVSEADAIMEMER